MTSSAAQRGMPLVIDVESGDITRGCMCRAVRGGAAGAARAAPLFGAKFVIIARVHSLLSGATPHYRSMAANSLKATLPSFQSTKTPREPILIFENEAEIFFRASAVRASISLPSGASTLRSVSRPTPGELPTALMCKSAKVGVVQKDETNSHANDAFLGTVGDGSEEPWTVNALLNETLMEFHIESWLVLGTEDAVVWGVV